MSMRIHRALFCLLLALIGLSVLLLNVHMPLMMDDYDYSFSWATGERLDGIGDIFASQAAHYRLWGGRSVTHFLAQLFLLLGKPVFNVANTLMYLLLLLEVYALSKRRETRWDWRGVLAAHVLLLFVVPFFGVAFLWLDGACNYLWGTALALVPLLIARSERENGWFDTGWRWGFVSLPLAFLAGWTNENTACGVLAALSLLLLWDALRGRQVRAWRVAMLIAQALGVALMLLAPGNFARAAEESSRGFAMEMIYRFAVVSYCLLRYAGIPAILGAAALAVAVRRRKALRWTWLCVLAGTALLSAYALVGSPQISDRSFTSVIVLLICIFQMVMHDLKPIPDRHSLCVGACLALLAVLGSWQGIGAAARHEEAWLAQIQRIEAAAQAGEESVSVSSVLSDSRFTMEIRLEADGAAWPNSTLGEYYGICVLGQ